MGEVIKLRVASSEEAITLQSAAGSLAVEAVSPRVAFTKVDGGTRLDITDIDGTKSAILPDGAMGPIGPSGATGPAGIGIVSCELLPDYRLMITYSNGTYDIVGPIRGAQGEIGPIGPSGIQGPSGVGIVYCELLQDYRLQITYSNGTYDIVGPIRGPQGETGNDGSPGADGTTFTPSVSSNGVLSWTNDGGRTNPQSVNIKGPKGDTGETGPQGDDYVLTNADKNEIADSVFVQTPVSVAVKTQQRLIKYSTGIANPYDGLNASEYIDVSSFFAIRYSRTKTALSSANNGIAFYDANKDYISGIQTMLNQDGFGYWGLYDAVVPSGAKYARFTMIADTETHGEFQLYGLTRGGWELGKKQDMLTFDSAPTSGSTNPVTSGGVYTALQAKADPVVVETVSGTDPVITGVDNHRYVCGTVDTLTLTPPASGIVDVVFTSGTTPTVLTVTPPSGKTMLWPGWFDSSSLDASKTYELNIMDGVYGAVAAWT